MTRSIRTSLAGVTHNGDLGANFNQGDPSVRRLPRLCWRELQRRMPRCTSLTEVVLARASTRDALVYVAWKRLSQVDDVRGGLGANVNTNVPVFIVDVIRGMRSRPREGLRSRDS
ncbi:hypothetical protein CRG98_006552 [Punica granatum]|uniref:Uncharacterized protein n=1 Tax=Punica granatum TaxID=22663 RepID=A0A2I0KX61_PUNGR|nr:hypothetical protein CRG98_006552 [Punica granatum]